MVTKTSHLPIRYFLALLWAHPILHISTIRVKYAGHKTKAHVCIKRTLLQYYYCCRLRVIASITGKPAASIFCLDHGGSRFCQSLANNLWDYWVLYPKRPYSKSSPQCKPRISYCYTTLVKYFQTLVMAVLFFVSCLQRRKEFFFI